MSSIARLKAGRTVATMTTALLLFALGSLASADELGDARSHFERGSKAFALGAYDEAIAEYSAAFRKKDDPVLLYNIAQAHRLAGHAPEALRFYKMYLTLVPDAQNRDEVQSKIDELARLVEEQKRTQQALPPDTVHPPSAPKPESDRSDTTGVSGLTQTPALRSKPKLVGGTIVAATGLAALAAGIGLSVAAKQDSDSLSNPTTPYDPAKASAGATFGKLGPALLGVGGALVISGAVVAVLGIREQKRTTTVRLTPLLGRDRAGIAVEVRQ
jgi:tetratricopeptide (TPR) repeat protein